MIKITSEEYCRFSVNGRLRLLDLFGKIVFEKITETETMVVFKLNDFYVRMIKDLNSNSVTDRQEFHEVIRVFDTLFLFVLNL